MAALNIRARDDAFADALHRRRIRVLRSDPFPRPPFSRRFRRETQGRCEKMDADMMACDGGSNARGDAFR